MRIKAILLCVLFFLAPFIYSQNTLGTILNSSGVYSGYTLFAFGNKTYLINNCGQRINEWTSDYITMGTVYLLEDGSILRSGTTNNSDINFGGVSGRIEKFDWDGNLIWQFNYSDNTKRLHHDFFPLPNGNILALAVTKLTNQDAIDLGRDPNNLINNLYNEQIIEIQPQGFNGGEIVWQWNIKDHIIQDFDDTKPNFGIVSENPGKLNINFLNGNSSLANWLHFNSIQYNESLKQIILSSRLMSEIYIIEHSVSSSVAESSTGGLYNAGGDFLYRWGNSNAYNVGAADDQKLFGQHHANWIPDGYPEANKIMLFNNGAGRFPSVSEIFILDLPITDEGIYTLEANTSFGPIAPDYNFNSENFYSQILSSAQMLPNGNILICDGDSGRFFEIDENDTLVWEYINPVSISAILSQGEIPTSNLVFRALKYGEDYPAFTGRNLIPGNVIETNPEILPNCDTLSLLETYESVFITYPNPTNKDVNIKSIKPIKNLKLYNALGLIIETFHDDKGIKRIDVSNLSKGVYFLLFEGNSTAKKIVKF